MSRWPHQLGGRDDFGGPVPGIDDPELGQHVARPANRSRAVLGALVPTRWGTEQRERIAGAERAHDQVMHVLRVLDHDEAQDPQRVVPAAVPVVALLLQDLGRVLEEPGAERVVGPRTGDEHRPVLGAEPAPVELDGLVHFRALDEAAGDERVLQAVDARGQVLPPLRTGIVAAHRLSPLLSGTGSR